MFAAGKTNAVSGQLYVDDVFSTWLYTGNGSTQTITNGIDLAGSGGMVWIKQRNSAVGHALYDTARGVGYELSSNTTTESSPVAQGVTSFNANGVSFGTDGRVNTNAAIYASWTFRKAPKFFDVVTYTGNGETSRQISHSLGVAPGMVVIKRTDSTGDWLVWHRSINTDGTNDLREYLLLNSTAAVVLATIGTDRPWVSSSGFTSTHITIATDAGALNNINGATYVAYLFAHDTATDGIIQCGSYTTDGSGNATVNLGWEPQFLIHKSSSAVTDWRMQDVMRGWTNGGTDYFLAANTTAAESGSTGGGNPTATGFSVTGMEFSATYIYIAIRRPNKPPTTGTQVFMPTVYSSDNTDNRFLSTGILTDMAWFRRLASSGTGYEGMVVGDRLRGQPWLKTGATAAEVTQADALDQQLISTTEYGTAFSAMTGVWVGNNSGTTVGSANINTNAGTNNCVVEAFKRAPGVFDAICYTGTGSATTQAHNLGVVPELAIIKQKSAGGLNWPVFTYNLGDFYLSLNTTNALSGPNAVITSTPSATNISLGTSTTINGSGSTYVAYLFATSPGISKVFSYTGNGTSQTINCGFTTGARFVLIKRTDSTGDWYVWDSARGIVAGNDPHLSLNGTAAEVTTDDSVDTDSTGFIVNQLAATDVNVTSATYIGLAFA